MLREEREEVLVPAPGAMPHAVDEEEGSGVGGGGVGTGDGFEEHETFLHSGVSSKRHEGTKSLV
jgi:hypothetical protein